MVRIIQYNLLSQKLCSPKWFISCLPEACDPESRWLRIKTKLLGEIRRDSILCLQEISQIWAGRLTTFFSENNYQFVFRLYGTDFSDYMGVGIAFPMNKYSLKDCHFVRVGDLIPRPPKKEKKDNDPVEDNLSTYIWNNSVYWSKRLINKVNRWWTPYQKVDDLWAKSRAKWNVLVMVSLVIISDLPHHRKGELVVANYHMPCDFLHSTVMTLHSYYAMMEAQKFAQGRAGLVFCGDFNFKPESKQYQMITEGRKAVESDFQDNSWTAIKNWFDEQGFQPMESAYETYNGKEPQFTNYAMTARGTEVFEATLDYIFVSSDITVLDVIKLPQERPVDIYLTPLPTAEEPSDHLMLGADIGFAL